MKLRTASKQINAERQTGASLFSDRLTASVNANSAPPACGGTWGRGAGTSADRLMCHLNVALSRAGTIPIPDGKRGRKNITVHICRGDLPVKTFILTLNYNLISHYRHKKFTAHHIAAGHGHKLSLIFTFDVAKQMILIWGWMCAAEEGWEAACTESIWRQKHHQRLFPPVPTLPRDGRACCFRHYYWSGCLKSARISV